MKKDETEIQNHKKQMIDQILKLDKSKMFEEPPKKKTNIIDKLAKIFGYGKKG